MKKILIIDDEELILQLLQKMLEEEGHQVRVALNGEVGLEMFKHEPADLVITDMVMPVKDGLKTILELREIDEEVPVIAISGGGTIAKERYLAIASHLDNVVTVAKPLSRADILNAVRELLF
ncbi:MAG: response regulator [Desulfocapsaceae bacterium]|nr:response regulator [Desulfocapsaceae bacterium]